MPTLLKQALDAVQEHQKGVLATGDLLIILDCHNPKRSFRLSSTTLFTASMVLEQLCKPEDGAFVEKDEKSGVKYLLVLKEDEDQDGGVPGLKRESLAAKGEKKRIETATDGPTTGAETEPAKATEEHTGEPTSVFAPQASMKDWPRAYEVLLRIILGAKTAALHKRAATTALPLLETVVRAAQKLGAIAAIQPCFADLFMRYIGEHQLWRVIAQAPTRWLFVGATLESPTIYKEAFIHVVGALGLEVPNELRLQLPAKVLAALERKAHDLRGQRLAAEMQLLLLTEKVEIQPPLSTTNAEDGETESPVKNESTNKFSPTPWTDATVYHVVCIWREWVREHLHHLNQVDARIEQDAPTTEICPHTSGCLNRAGFYRTLEDEAYLPTEPLLECWPYRYAHDKSSDQSGENSVIRSTLEGLKRAAKDIAKDLAASRLQYEGKHELAYLTCIEVTQSEIPWVVAGEAGVDEDDEEIEDD